MIYCSDPIPTHYPHPPEFIRTPCPLAGHMLAQRSLTLRKLFASYLIDAVDFFAGCGTDWVWSNLTSLSLTSKLLVSTTRYTKIYDLLVAAGKMALRMPKLERMEIWNGTKRNACVFRYQATRDSTSIEWCGTWNQHLSYEVVEVWKQVAQTNTSNHLSVQETRIWDENTITSHAVAIRKLELSDGVVHPVSLEQIRRETERYWFK